MHVCVCAGHCYLSQMFMDLLFSFLIFLSHKIANDPAKAVQKKPCVHILLAPHPPLSLSNDPKRASISQKSGEISPFKTKNPTSLQQVECNLLFPNTFYSGTLSRPTELAHPLTQRLLLHVEDVCRGGLLRVTGCLGAGAGITLVQLIELLLGLAGA